MKVVTIMLPCTHSGFEIVVHYFGLVALLILGGAAVLLIWATAVHAWRLRTGWDEEEEL